jgi:integrase
VTGRRSRNAPVSFTDAWVKGVKHVAEGYRMVPDRDVGGLFLRVGIAEKGWQVYRTLNGKPVRVGLGTYPEVPLADARKRARGALALIGKGLDPRDYRPEQLEAIAADIADGSSATKAIAAIAAGELTFGQLAEKFLASPAVKGKPSENETRRIVETYFLADPPRPKRGERSKVSVNWTNTPVSVLTAKTINEALDQLVERGRVQANHCAQTLNRALRWSAKKGHIPALPLFDTMPGGAEKSRDRVLTDGELRRVWEAATEPVFGQLVRFLIVTACRKGEARDMRWEDIDREKRLWTLPTTKSGHGNEVPLCDLALSILDQARKESIADSEYVFSVTGGVLGGFGKSTKRLRDKAQIRTRWTLHDLRRSAATKMAEPPLSIPSKPTISRVLGHAESGVTSRYVRASWLPEKRSALDRWAAHLATTILASAK